MPDTITPTPGDPATEPVATAAQSHVAGRVGPPTIAQDATAAHHTPEGVTQIAPGQIAEAGTPFEGGVVDAPSLTEAAEAELDAEPKSETAVKLEQVKPKSRG